MNLLLLSNSRNPDSGYLEHALPWMASALEGVRRLAFVPYAAVRFSWDDYRTMVADALDPLGIEVRSTHEGDPVRIVDASDAVAVGGGNTFHLVERMHALGLMDAIRARAIAGTPFVGWSAGSNVACPTLRTTNDMPIIEPASFDALGLVPFQINPHYLDAHPDRHMGETREERLLEFTVVNPDVRVIGLREGSALRRRGDALDLVGPRPARLFLGATEPREVEAGTPLAFLLQP